MITQLEGEALNTLIRLVIQVCKHDAELNTATHCLEMADLELLLVMAARFAPNQKAEEGTCPCGQQLDSHWGL